MSDVGDPWSFWGHGAQSEVVWPTHWPEEDRPSAGTWQDGSWRPDRPASSGDPRGSFRWPATSAGHVEPRGDTGGHVGLPLTRGPATGGNAVGALRQLDPDEVTFFAQPQLYIDGAGCLRNQQNERVDKWGRLTRARGCKGSGSSQRWAESSRGPTASSAPGAFADADATGGDKGHGKGAGDGRR